MNKQLRERFPKWTKEINSNNKLILTNDLDSLFTTAVLKKLFGCEVDLFYDFKSMYWNGEIYDSKNIIGCDLAIEDKETKTFCNHVTRMWKDDEVNPLSANLNNIAGIYGGKHMTNYTEKYAGSTLFTVLSLYDAFDSLLLEDHKELTEVQKMILVSVDSYFYGKYFKNGEHFYQWQEWLGLEMFNDVLDKYSKSDLMDFQKQYSLKGEIGITDDLQLFSWLNTEFLQEHFPMLDFNVNQYQFDSHYDFSNTYRQQYFTSDSKHDLKGDVFSLSVINQNTVKYTTY